MSGGALIVGAGHGGFSAAAALRKAGYEGAVTLLDAQDETPYQRPPLSKDVLHGDAEPGGTPLRPASFYEKQDVGLRTGVRVAALHPAEREVELDGGERLAYDHLVLATGARTRPLEVAGTDLPGVHELRTAADARGLLADLGGAANVVVVGGGWIGLEVAAGAREAGADVTVLEAVDRTLARVASPDLSAHVRGLHEAAGATVRHDVRVAALVPGDDGRVAGVELEGGERLDADVVVVGVGVVPNLELARDAGLETGDGVLVDEHLRTSDERIWAVGDVASFPRGGGRLRIESVQNATDQGRVVASTICGDPQPYAEVPWFWSVQHGARVQIAGLAHGHDAVVVRGDPAAGSGSFFCFAGDRLAAVESVAAPKDHMAARRLLAAGVSPTREQAADPDVDLGALAAG